MGTNAVFFFSVNVAKIPLMLAATQIKLHMGFDPEEASVMTGSTFLLTLIFAPGILLGGVIGRKIYRSIPEKIFVPFILSLNFATAVYILITACL